ncbi:MAG: hypothetical protein IKC17_06030 [Bacteroidales bacterium]|nr:hypothetical protein [Bacteroidales bacterium]
MHRFFNYFLALMSISVLFLSSCEKNSGGVDEPTPPTPEQKEMPSLVMTASEVTTESVSFILTPENASSVRYAVYPVSETLPTVEQLMTPGTQFSGKPADAVSEDLYVVDGLNPGTEYIVIAAAANSNGYSDMQSLNMVTTIPPVELELEVLEITSSSVLFNIAYANASEVSYLLTTEGEGVDAEVVFNEGVAISDGINEYSEVDLEASTQYYIYAAAKDLAGDESTVVVTDFTTEEGLPEMTPPSVGDFYYSDGTWSTEYDQSKTPIGVVFYIGVANEFSDNATYYKTKTGSSMDDFHGYVVALNDSGPSSGVWWSFFDGSAEATGVSTEVDDFLGYTNTLAIKAKAEKLGVGFSDANTSYPAAYYASDGYEQVCPSPNTSSGWFLPAAGQLQYIWDQVYFNPNGNLKAWLENSFEILGDLANQMHTRDSEYWSSTEQVDSYATSVRAYYVCYDSSNFEPGFTAWYNKNTNFRVRSILAF